MATNSVSNQTTATSGNRLVGYMSGLDVDTIVKEMSAATQKKLDKAAQSRQLEQWRQEAYWAVSDALTSFYDKYFNSSASSNITNAAFFDVAQISSSSSAINVSGSTAAARRMAVTGVSRLARQAGFTSAYKVSNQAAAGTKIQESWRPSAIGGASVEIEYGGKKHSLSLDTGFVYDTGDSPEKILQALNRAVTNNADLKGKLSFTLEDGAVTLQTASEDDTFRISGGSQALLGGLGLTVSEELSASVTGTDIQNNLFFSTSLAAGSRLELTLDGKAQVITLTKAVALTPERGLENLKTALTEAIGANSALAGKLSVDIGEDGALSFTAAEGELHITGGSRNLLQGLGLSEENGEYTHTGTVDTEALLTRHLDESLSGATLTLKLSGLSRGITFLESEKHLYSTAEGLASYLQQKADAAFGAGRVTVGLSPEGALSFGASDPHSVVEVASSDVSGVLGPTGALRIYAGETNRINAKKTLSDLSASMKTALTPMDGTDSFGLTVNGREFTFSGNQSLQSIIDTINADVQANVEISYSSTTDSFTVRAKNGGSASQADVADLGGSNLATALFGRRGETDENGALIPGSGDYTVSAGQDALLTVSFDGDPLNAVEIVRSENQFTLDGVNFILHAATGDQVSAEKPITFTVTENTDQLADKLKTFVEDYNAIIKQVSDLVTEKKAGGESYLPLTDTQKSEMSEAQIAQWEKNAKKGLLQGDLMLSALVTEFRRSMTDMVGSVQGGLFQFGINTEANNYASNGKLVINETTLKTALTGNLNRLQSLFTGTDGIAARMKTVVQKNVGTYGGDGLLVLKAGKSNGFTLTKSTLTKSIESYDERIRQLKVKLQAEQDRYYAQFTRLETYLNAMNTQAGLFLQSE